MKLPFSQTVLEVAAAHAWELPEVEVCGYIHNGAYHRTPNLSTDPMHSCCAELPELEGLTFFHSHPTGPDSLTMHDCEAAIATGTPYLVFSMDPIGWAYFDPTHLEETPYDNRPYLYGVWDCFSLVRDFLTREMRVTIPDYTRRYAGEWEQEGWSTFDNEWPKYFVEVDVPQRGDVLMLSTSEGGKTDHIGVFEDDRLFYHHLHDRNSLKSLYGNYWVNRTARIVRLREVVEKESNA